MRESGWYWVRTQGEDKPWPWICVEWTGAEWCGGWEDDEFEIIGQPILDRLAKAEKLVDALRFVKGFFQRLEDGTDPEDSILAAARKRYHAPVHKAIDEALADFAATKEPHAT